MQSNFETRLVNCCARFRRPPSRFKFQCFDALLTLAKAAEVGTTDNPVTLQEVKRKIGKLVRSHDGGISLKASELFLKLDQADKARAEHPDDDGFSAWRLCRDLLRNRQNGASAWMLLYRSGAQDAMGHPGNYPLLHDVWSLAQGEPFGPQIFEWVCRDMTDETRKNLEKKLANKNYQLEARQKIWAEIGIGIDGNGRAKLVGHAA